ncbi:hypothetical protein [Nocardioides aquiterrae]|uniref:Uncharacterized protein n=1 Tax=Nocardioides aquiterrae TaxID=203799 RepID=A0ABP4FC34_9ACTN
MIPTADDFQALARSSPWRWTTLHFRHRSAYPGACEAWVRRPGELLVRLPDGREVRASGLPYTRVMVGSFVPDGSPAAPPPPEPVLPHEATPAYRPDGLVAQRPSSFEVGYDDPMYGNYSWVAMLDPVELSHHVEVTNLREDEVAGRLAWRADLRALPGYEPRCGGNCCELLYSEAGLLADFESLDQVPEARRGREYPDHYDVALDVGTGIVVRCLQVGGAPGAAWLENDVLDVG